VENKPVTLSKHFERSFCKRIEKNKTLTSKYKKNLALFLINRSAPTLKDHALRGTLNGYRAFSVTDSVRVVYLNTEERYQFVDIGTHDQAYGKH